MAGQDSPPISLAEIDAIPNLREGLRRLNDLGIDYAGVKNKDDVVIRLRKYLKGHGQGVAEDPINGGVFFVDSPGIGECEKMTKLTKSYMSKAHSFIYVINSMVAGGVQEDRAQMALKQGCTTPDYSTFLVGLRKLFPKTLTSYEESKYRAEQAARQIKDFLKRNKKRVIEWNEEDCPQPTEWNDLHLEARTLVHGRIRELLKEWNTNTEFFTYAQKELIEKFRSEFNILENQIALMEGQLTSNDMVVVEDANPTDLSDEEDIALTTAQKVIIGVTSPLWIVISLPIAIGMAVKELINEKKQIKEYAKQRSAVMKTIAEKVLEDFSSDEYLVGVVMRYLNSAVATLNDLLNAIPKLLDDDRQLVKRLQIESQTADSEMQLHQKKLHQNENLEGRLGLLYVTNIREDINAETEINWSSPAIAAGTFGDVYAVTLPSRKKMKAAAKVMKQCATAENVCKALLEEEILRGFHTAPNIIKFIGTSAIIEPGGNRRLVILMEYCPKTLANRMLNADATSPKGGRETINPGLKQPLDPGLMRSVADFGRQICSGLSCMHAKGYIHRDLKLENILAGSDKTVKLLNISKPVTIPSPDPDSPIGSMVYLPYSVLDGTKPYDAGANIYAFGLMMWEIWHNEHVFKNQRDSAVRVFSSGIRQGNSPLTFETGKIDPTLEAYWEKTMRACLSGEIAIKDWKEWMYGINYLLNTKESVE
ncbi:uncharacterized protein LOC106164177 [Lingula anatina]|uniref:Uncharacterized protein LOC106164177 n=1 Tax=Lingula anatina TaxID=7574 RepID=A0A1S3IGQ0_LINAN|nr:uncharacterized protein LOC106164177 [Lingula anatina]|eukprot:XP_013397440.1 uncharacterized protein LOC106164177 [Lingula anatina]